MKTSTSHWILFGFPTCGKSTLGQLLAKALKMPWIDTDHLLEKRHHLPARALHQTFGETLFRKAEQDILFSLHTYPPSIISLGGGGILQYENRIYLSKLGTLIYLKCAKQQLKERLHKRGVPSFLNPLDFDASFEQMFLKRAPIYEQMAHMTLDIKDQSPPVILEELVQYMKFQSMPL
ncbi:MAG: hypothetical protein K9M07_03130 [Simkaniaceae bacterium]|nr:hypothetical protein [Simkaniaceae bacterium]